ncbi:pro-sigmaK processing inhibitor BofA family protein [Sulfobacillus harzensis]|uniref:SigmaK-factor processing regulatory BofA n=1 Tax=Sulfobacillus harzensis TaxID=2729629 RepID=A0A7Y0L5F2_9FIRM|nr:pro-sigmaK processing inhibitor BofA family protein [Sulfobacillus harzensis]NMP23639.1 SigmaK-factor processing regulatory BofA [Sulfobacillus harzensis]
MNPRDFLAIVFGGVMLYVVVRVFQSPAKWAVRVLINGIVGLAALWAWDMAFTPHGWAVGLNPVTGLTVGVLGAPGFLLLLAVKVLIL